MFFSRPDEIPKLEAGGSSALTSQDALDQPTRLETQNIRSAHHMHIWIALFEGKLMADTSKRTDGPSPFSSQAFDPTEIPDFDTQFIAQEDINAFAQALNAPEANPVTALNDWRPVHQRVRKRYSRSKKQKRRPRRTTDETREGFVYALLKWPLLVTVFGWLGFLGLSYLFTRLYIWSYEHIVTWRGQRERLRRKLRSATNYSDWVDDARELDAFLGNEKWKEKDDYAYYDFNTIRRVRDNLRSLRERATKTLDGADKGTEDNSTEELKNLVEACVKNNFSGVENPRLYSESYYGTKWLAQSFVDELERSLSFLLRKSSFKNEEKFLLAKHLHNNFGRTALCLSGGASFAYYHFGVVKALLDASLLPDVITGTSGGALVAALAGTRTDEELKKILVPALAHKINACEESIAVWFPRWWRTGARFDSLDWARKCSWFTRGSTTFREAYQRTGRILNVTCVPSDPHSPSILANYLTAPNCTIWSAVLASAAVPGILNPVVLMMKNRDGSLSPYSFGHKWKDGSLRTDIPLRALNLHFNVNFSIVSQVNPHINLFFFSSRGTVGRPVTHRKGRGWRGGFLGSATEQYLKLDLTKWLKVLRHLELLPRPMGQDWSQVWLQNFSGTVTVWPRSEAADFWRILSDPDPKRLARMLQVGQQSAFPKLLFIANRMKIERLVEEGLLLGSERLTFGGERDDMGRPNSLHLHGQEMRNAAATAVKAEGERERANNGRRSDSLDGHGSGRRRSGVMEELVNQTGVFFDDPPEYAEADDTDTATDEEAVDIVDENGNVVG